MNSKILSYIKAPEIIDEIRSKGKRIVQCHGTFDLIHPGHIVHFEEAKALGDILVVTVTDEQHVNKGPGRPIFNDQLRVRSLAALACVDYVVLIPFPAAVEAIKCVKPDVYCKGKEYVRDEVDVTGNIVNDRKTVERFGGKMAYVGSVVFSSTRLLNQHFDAYAPHVKSFSKAVAEECDKDGFRRAVEALSDKRVLIVGDTIFDRYSTVSVQGLTSKNRILSGRFLREDTQAGGALAVFRHIREFTENVKLVSLVGTESWVEDEIAKHVHPNEDEIVRIPDFTTIVKQRFVEPLPAGKELSKLFSVNYINKSHPGPDVQRYLIDRINQFIDDVDLVLVMDFGHGVMEKEVRVLVQERAPFLSLNCQTNSNNHGFNLINRQYHRADSFSLDETEMKLAVGRKAMDYSAELQQLRKAFGAQYAWLTRGGTETIGAREGEESVQCPPFEVNIVDTIGAGDAFCSVASLAACSGLPIKTATFMGQLAGSEAVRYVGNSLNIKKSRFLKGSEAMLSV
ncbi:MAG: adenylyltransferase/cytidyltransferase family protein [Kiritimatiellae bacterium]|nr:adenylyltransferase/cytidyltransferase family protein [Kiritimatiellia bacterium]